MKKLTILKTIVDIFWMISILSIPLILAFLIFTIFDNSLLGKPITVNGIRFTKLIGSLKCY